jgi:hypothetical protein
MDCCDVESDFPQIPTTVIACPHGGPSYGPEIRIRRFIVVMRRVSLWPYVGPFSVPPHRHNIMSSHLLLDLPRGFLFSVSVTKIVGSLVHCPMLANSVCTTGAKCLLITLYIQDTAGLWVKTDSNEHLHRGPARMSTCDQNRAQYISFRSLSVFEINKSRFYAVSSQSRRNRESKWPWRPFHGYLALLIGEHLC